MVGVSAARSGSHPLCAGIVLAGLAVFSLPPAPASADWLESERAEVATLPAHIATVLTGGEWESGGERGFYRIVVTAAGIEHVSNRIYIQRIALAFADNGYRLVTTRRVEELDPLGVAASVEADFYGQPLPVVTISTTDREMKRRSYRLTLMPSGTYRLE